MMHFSDPDICFPLGGISPGQSAHRVVRGARFVKWMAMLVASASQDRESAYRRGRHGTSWSRAGSAT